MTATRSFFLFTIASSLALSCGAPTQQPLGESPLDVDRLAAAPQVSPAPARMISTGDGAQLAYREYVAEQARAALVFYHGGGAHSGATYQVLAKKLSKHHKVTVITPDLRGHGLSSGRRGDAPSTKTVLRDVGRQIRAARKRHPRVPLFLGGHSSGAGLVLNFSSNNEQMRRAAPLAGFVFVAPQLGFRSKTERSDVTSSFASVKVGKFVLHSMSFGLFAGHDYAVFFNYPKSALDRDPRLVIANSVNMASALTPTNPRSQVRNLDAPLGVWLAEDDLLIDEHKVRALLNEERPSAYVQTIRQETHLSVLLHAAQHIGPWMQTTRRPDR